MAGAVVFIATNAEGSGYSGSVLWTLDRATSCGPRKERDLLFGRPIAGSLVTCDQKTLKIEASGGRPQGLCDATETGGGAWNKEE